MIDLYRLCEELKNPESDFGKNSAHIIRDIYTLLLAPSARTEGILQGWKAEFRYLYGDPETNLSGNKKTNADKILERYGILPEREERSDDERAGSDKAGQVQLLFFAVQTFFSVLLKAVMQEILAPGFPVTTGEDILRGRFAEEKGIQNYCRPDWYLWPVHELQNGFEGILDKLRKGLAAYRYECSLREFVESYRHDHIKQIYEALIPRELRHALGEYYTPDWLAEETLATALSFAMDGICGRFIDPTCGSGTFLLKVIAEKRKRGQSLEEILRTVCGIDINPLAVFTAKTNYLLAIVDLIESERKMELPVYQADVIRLGGAAAPGEREKCGYADQRIAASVEKADIVIGNPPWVNWEYLPEAYRRESQHLWADYRLFSATGRALSFSKEDISALITYVVLDKLLKNGGILAFVIRQGIFKSAQNGVGFRRFTLKEECGIKVLRADDLSGLKVFENAAVNTAILYLKKGEETVYPVPYIVWQKRAKPRRAPFNGYSGIRDVKAQVTLTERLARPAVQGDTTSMWMTAEGRALQGMEKFLGKNSYRARTGVFTGGANAVYWLEILRRIDEGVEVSNLVERAKRKTEKISRVIEPDYLFPMLKGSNVRRWRTSYDTYLLCPHTAGTKMWPVAQSVLEETAPNTLRYLQFFQRELDERKGFAGWEREIQHREFHAVLRVGEYTFSPYKVVWKYIATEFVCAVTGSVQDPFLGEKPLLPNEKVMYIGTDCEAEAYYLCGVLSSTPVAECVKSYMNPTSISAHVLDKLNIPDFDGEDPDHAEIARICREGHGKEDVSPYIERIDRLIDRIYGQ